MSRLNKLKVLKCASYGGYGPGARSNMVCFGCRRSFKVNLTCPTCRQKTVSIGYRRHVPKRTDEKGWKELAEFYKVSDKRFL